MVFQNLALYPHMTAWENMSFGLQARKQTKTEIRRRIEEAAAVLAIGDCLDRLPAALSGGQRQASLLVEPSCSNPGSSCWMSHYPIWTLHCAPGCEPNYPAARQTWKTIIYVTHDQLEAMALGDRIAVMKEGPCSRSPPPWNYTANLPINSSPPSLGHPAMNFFRGTLLRSEQPTFSFKNRPTPNRPMRVPSNPGHFACKFRLKQLPGFPLSTARQSSSESVRKKSTFSSGMENGTSAKLERIENLGVESHLHLTTASAQFHHAVLRHAEYQRNSIVPETNCRSDSTFNQPSFFIPTLGLPSDDSSCPP